jgi:hypothetical protein
MTLHNPCESVAGLLHFAHGDVPVTVTGPQNWFIPNSVGLHRLLIDSPGSEGLRAFINILTYLTTFVHNSGINVRSGELSCSIARPTRAIIRTLNRSFHSSSPATDFRMTNAWSNPHHQQDHVWYLIASLEGHALLIATLHPVDPIYARWFRSRWATANRHSARCRQRHPELPLFMVLKARIRPSSSQANQRLPEPMVSYRTHHIFRSCPIF